jgi:ribulose kinase
VAVLGQATRGALAAGGIAPNQVIAMAVDTTCCSVVALDAQAPHAMTRSIRNIATSMLR